MEKSPSERLRNLKKFRLISLITWTVIGIVILLMILYANVHVQWQGTVTIIVRVFIFASLVETGYSYHLNKKIRALKETESFDQ